MWKDSEMRIPRLGAAPTYTFALCLCTQHGLWPDGTEPNVRDPEARKYARAHVVVDCGPPKFTAVCEATNDEQDNGNNCEGRIHGDRESELACWDHEATTWVGLQKLFVRLRCGQRDGPFLPLRGWFADDVFPVN